MSATGVSGLDGYVSPRPAETSPRPEPIWDETVVVAHEVIGGKYHRLVIYSPTIAERARAGQFVMITVPDSAGSKLLLPRPMAIHRRHHDSGTVEVIFNVVGRGTDALSGVEPGDRLLLTGPLGRGFEIPESGGSVVLIGRGIGVCAVMGVAEDAAERQLPVTAVLSASTHASIIGIEDCHALGAKALLVSDDTGTSDVGSVISALREQFRVDRPGVIMVCGSNRLARAAVSLGSEWDVPVQVSLEVHMACGLGYCHGCAAPTVSVSTQEGPLVCVDGPVFDAHEPVLAR